MRWAERTPVPFADCLPSLLEPGLSTLAACVLDPEEAAHPVFQVPFERSLHLHRQMFVKCFSNFVSIIPQSVVKTIVPAEM